jgi:hypothetical protein
MNLYHASFNGRRADENFQPLRRIAVVVAADSIYDVKPRIKESYEFVTGLCVTNCEATGRELFEVSSK